MLDPAERDKIIALGLLRNFPPSIQVGVASSEAFRTKYGQHFDVTIGMAGLGISVRRSLLYPALRTLYRDQSASIPLKIIDGREGVLSFDGASGVPMLTIGEDRYRLPSFRMLSPDQDVRASWLQDELSGILLERQTVDDWISKVKEGPLSDDDIDDFHADVNLTPSGVAAAVRAELQNNDGRIDRIIPSKIRYYSRLIGERGGASDINSYASGSATSHIQDVLAGDYFVGLAQVLSFCAAPQLTQLVDLSGRPGEEVENFFQAVARDGDSWSQIAAIEVGLRALPVFPKLEPIITDMLVSLRDQDVSDPKSKLRLTSTLFVFTDGQLSRVRTFEGQPPFWRRLAAIAQAALIERELLLAGADIDFSEWTGLRAEDFYMQSLADIRTEPRWLPDLIAAEQLKIEFIARARIVATQVKESLPEKLNDLLLGDGPNSLSAYTPAPLAFFASPVEGGVTATLPFPPDMLTDFKEPKDDKPLNAKIFASVINLALVFKIEPEIPATVSQILRKVKYRLTLGENEGVSFSLLSGLAVLAAVTRSAELAEELRILTRVFRRRGEFSGDYVSQMRIAIIACASNEQLHDWCSAVGDWMLELANEELDKEEARRIHSHLVRLCKIEPRLWPFASKAEAALASIVR